MEHAVSSIHKSAIDSLKHARMLFLSNSVAQSTTTESIIDSNLVTQKMFRTVYFEVKYNLPFSSHPSLVTLQLLNGITFGTHHRSADYAIKITEFF